ncbi:excisionase [Sporofaciens sp. SGI.106]|uniref:excisionase n=1 Tax=Sporofaciens sp. SGI.106 TaxID=3420568 RepID=UPI003D007680
MTRTYHTPFSEKYTLSIEQAADYFGIGQKKLRQIVDDHKDADFILRNGAKVLIKRKKFEEFIDNTNSI